MIATRRLRFVAVEQRHKRALAAGVATLGELLGVQIPGGWPQFPEAFTPAPGAPESPPSQWCGYFFVDGGAAALVGNGGFHEPPNDAGELEFGYEIAPEFQNRGYATEAARGLAEFAFADARVRRVVAHTLAHKNASNAVLIKAGFQFVEELPNDEVGKVWRWDRARSPD
jgi:[ribosomal protein S5]-alanine N-acetyltransferase